MRALRRQLPAYSPLTAAAIGRATAEALDSGADPAGRLAALLVERYAAAGVELYGSGTQALGAGLRAAMEVAGPKRPVALPAYTCYDVATAAVASGSRVLLYDIDPDTPAPDWSSVEAVLRQGAGVVVLSPLYGFPFSWDTPRDLARQHEAVLVEDAAQGGGASYGGEPVGSFGTLSVLSFGRGKGWTGGRGGALLWRGTSLPAARNRRGPTRAAQVRTAAAMLAQLALARPAVYGAPHRIPWLQLGETRYRPPEEETSISRFSAAVILQTADLAAEEATGRRRRGMEMARALNGSPGLTPTRWPDEATPGFLRLPCRIHGPGHAAGAAGALGHLGVARGYPTTLAALPAIRERLATAAPAPLPGADQIARELVTLPTHGRLTPPEQEALIRSVTEWGGVDAA